MVSTRRSPRRKAKEEETPTTKETRRRSTSVDSKTRTSRRRTRSMAEEDEPSTPERPETTSHVENESEPRERTEAIDQPAANEALDATEASDDPRMESNVEEAADPDENHQAEKDDRKESEDEVGQAAGASRKASRKNSTLSQKTTKRNALTHLIPGYTAPLKLDAGALDTTSSLESMRRNELRQKAVPKFSQVCASFKRGPLRQAPISDFERHAAPMTEELKKDLALIRNRNYLDPKRFYKSSDRKTSEHVQVGTVIEGVGEYYSARLSKKQQRSTLVEEILADPSTAGYAQRKYTEMQRAATAKRRKRR